MNGKKSIETVRRVVVGVCDFLTMTAGFAGGFALIRMIWPRDGLTQGDAARSMIACYTVAAVTGLISCIIRRK